MALAAAPVAPLNIASMPNDEIHLVVEALCGDKEAPLTIAHWRGCCMLALTCKGLCNQVRDSRAWTRSFEAENIGIDVKEEADPDATGVLTVERQVGSLKPLIFAEYNFGRRVFDETLRQDVFSKLQWKMQYNTPEAMRLLAKPPGWERAALFSLLEEPVPHSQWPLLSGTLQLVGEPLHNIGRLELRGELTPLVDGQPDATRKETFDFTNALWELATCLGNGPCSVVECSTDLFIYPRQMRRAWVIEDVEVRLLDCFPMPLQCMRPANLLMGAIDPQCDRTPLWRFTTESGVRPFFGYDSSDGRFMRSLCGDIEKKDPVLLKSWPSYKDALSALPGGDDESGDDEPGDDEPGDDEPAGDSLVKRVQRRHAAKAARAAAAAQLKVFAAGDRQDEDEDSFLPLGGEGEEGDPSDDEGEEGDPSDDEGDEGDPSDDEGQPHDAASAAPTKRRLSSIFGKYGPRWWPPGYAEDHHWEVWTSSSSAAREADARNPPGVMRLRRRKSATAWDTHFILPNGWGVPHKPAQLAAFVNEPPSGPKAEVRKAPAPAPATTGPDKVDVALADAHNFTILLTDGGNLDIDLVRTLFGEERVAEMQARFEAVKTEVRKASAPASAPAPVTTGPDKVDVALADAHNFTILLTDGGNLDIDLVRTLFGEERVAEMQARFEVVKTEVRKRNRDAENAKRPEGKRRVE